MNTQEYIQAQKEWIEENNLEEGDTLLITKKAESYENGWGSPWVGNMSEIKYKTVSYSFSKWSDHEGILCKDEYDLSWLFPFFVLKKLPKVKEFGPFPDRVDLLAKRLSLGMTIVQVAKATGLNKGKISRIENNKGTQLDNWLILCKYYYQK